MSQVPSEFSAVPIIDISRLIGPSTEAERAEVAQQIGRACKDVGFFYITGHGISIEQQKDMDRLAREFFSFPVSVKESIRMSLGGRAWRGYFRVGDELTSGKPDLKEGLYFGSEDPADHPRVVANVPMHGSNQWPADEISPSMRSLVTNWMASMAHLGTVLCGAMSLALNKEESFIDTHFLKGNPLTLFRIFGYPSVQEYGCGKAPSEESPASADSKTSEIISQLDSASLFSVGAHTDYGLLTLLMQDDCGGLEVRNRAGEWIQAPPVENSIVVNLGDMINRLSGGLFRSTLHRVRNTSGRYRVSFPFFFDPCWDAELFPIIPKTADEEKTWDGHSVYEHRTYGHYILSKVASVFPDLAEEQKIIS